MVYNKDEEYFEGGIRMLFYTFCFMAVIGFWSLVAVGLSKILP